MQDTHTGHHDNLLGVCHAIGEAFGFNPIYLRIALAMLFVVEFKAALILYAIAGVAVLSERLFARFVPVSRTRHSA